MARRSRAREVALQLLFQRDQNPTGMPREAVEKFAADRLNDDTELAAYCLDLFDGVVKSLPEIDPKISATATNWRLHRMLAVDRNVLRLGVWELLYAEDVPDSVAITEAMALVTDLSTDESPQFVNGVLGAVQRNKASLV